MKEGDKTIELNSTEEEKDLGVFITKDVEVAWAVRPVSQKSPICAWYGEKTQEAKLSLG